MCNNEQALLYILQKTAENYLLFPEIRICSAAIRVRDRIYRLTFAGESR